MKKVAVMTWFNYDNYGSVLQAYSLLEILRKNDCNPSLINYDPNMKLKRNYNKESIVDFFRSNLMKIYNSFYTKKYYKNHSKNAPLFSKFREQKLTFTSKCNNSCELECLNEEFDCFICGSDQIWAPSVFDPKYFLDFVFDDNKKIAYAPSIGLPTIQNKNIKRQMANLISKFRYLSTREENGVKIIKEISNKDAELVLDPTLLIDKKEWEEKFSLKSNKESYVLYYCLGYNKKYYNLAKKVCRKYNLKLKVIPVSNIDYKMPEQIKSPIGPQEFLTEIYNASLVITDSFHGTIFSLNFNTPFITLKRFKDNNKSQNSRIYNILKLVSLEDRIYNDDSIINNVFTINFDNSNKQLQYLRKKSIEFLVNSLNNSSCKPKKHIITNYCTGCGACATVCPKHCIKIELNSYGFYEKKIDETKCIDCGSCKKICPQQDCKRKLNFVSHSEFYSGCSNNDAVLKNSSSGGIAYELGMHYLKQKKVVVGCAYNYTEHKAEHILVKEEEDLLKLSGSKYIQSNFYNILLQLKEYPDGGIIFGTPCQIAAADAYLIKNKIREKFLLVDLICHGVPSYHIWNKFLNEKFNGKKISKISFRSKDKGWKQKYMAITNTNTNTNTNTIYFPENKNPFYHFFDSGIYYNKACYECQYRRGSKADIRIGDYWGSRFKNDENGQSMICVFNTNANEVLKSINSITLNKQSVEDYMNFQQVINCSVPEFYEDINDDFLNKNNSLKQLDLKYAMPVIKKERRKKNILKILYYLKGIIRK